MFGAHSAGDGKIVYAIACHKNPEQVIRLMKAIYREDNLYFINIDKKSPPSFYEEIISSPIAAYKNIYFTNQAIDWGGWSQVQIILDAIDRALVLSEEWTHLINISGQDFPLKNQEEIRKYLSAHQNQCFIEARHFPPYLAESARLFSFRPKRYRKKKSLRLDLLFPLLKFYKGSQWMILSRNFCDYTLHGKMPRKLKPLFVDSYIPDESFFPTLAANWKLSSSVIWENKRFIDWSAGGAHPATLNMSYFDKIIASSAYFARKFDKEIDSEIIDKLEENL